MSEELEARIRELHDAGEYGPAATRGVDGYGDEVYSCLVNRMGNREVAAEVFAQACEDLWRGIEGFAWRCSFRTWMYTLARHAACRFERTPAEQAHRRGTNAHLSEIVDRVRTRTARHLRTEVKDRFASLREQLEPDQRTLLVLRIDRDLSWDDAAIALGEVEVDADATELKRAANRLRQRFHKVKQRLEELARAEGLLDVEP